MIHKLKEYIIEILLDTMYGLGTVFVTLFIVSFPLIGVLILFKVLYWVWGL